ncbi:MAG: NAD-dependent epimerase/dehydratase family protein [Bacteroidales bacterium]|nr:NAD-dependent epimerase/dehydratase family protein [Bacteroidales bacterium]
MKILVTGAKGFIGKNLIAQLKNIKEGKALWYDCPKDLEIYGYGRESSLSDLERYTHDCDFVFHLAGINRPKEEKEFFEGNVHFLQQVLSLLRKAGNRCPVVLSSSVQALEDNPYGKSKLTAEKELEKHAKENQSQIFIYRLTNTFGKWCKPDYNSVVATFCYRIAQGLPIKIDNPKKELKLIYIDDVVDELISCLGNKENKDGMLLCVRPEYKITVGDLAEKIYSFKESERSCFLPDVSDGFTKKLYSTYLSYMPEEEFSYPLNSASDQRGSFTELFKAAGLGQISVNISKPGKVKGEHWHNTKVEKFAVIKGKGLIQMRKEGLNAEGKPHSVLNFFADGENIKVINMIPGYTHNIVNLSENEDLITVIWANELFDKARPDTYSDKVNQD